MQNKGFVGFIAGALFLACAFYLSFSFVTSHYETEAKKVAAGDPAKYYAYMDSLSAETVWMGHTLKECREKELNLGLDLKGGMNVILEISVPDIVRALANQNSSENFNKAMNLAIERQANSQSDFLTLFEEAYNEVDANGKLAAIFSTFELKDKISLSSTNEEVMEVLRAEVESAVSNSFNVLRTRIDRFGVVQPNIQRLENSGRILVELPGIKEPERVRKLLQGSADLEFWETLDFAEIQEPIMAMNAMIRDMEKVQDATTDSSAIVESVKDSASVSGIDSLLASVTTDSAAVSQANAEEWAKENPLFAKIQLNMDYQSGRVGPGPLIGYVHVKDTAKVAEYFRLAAEKRIIPSALRPKWSVKAIDEAGNFFELVAINAKKRDGKAPMTGSVIADARADFNQHSRSVVSMEMNQEGAQMWARLTKENIGKCIAIVLDGYVYSYPRVNDEITGGRSEISGNFTVDEAKDLANVLKSGKMPAPAHIVQEDVVGPSLGQEAITAGLISFVIAFVLVLVYMIFYYGLIPGLIADIALCCNVFFIFSVLASFKAVLTLPGIAGIVLTLGMAVDANVLIYERIREELRAGKNIKKALADGYKNAFSAIIDSNVTTILTGIILFVFGTGPIKGFATTLIIGILCSFFTAVFISRLIFEWLLDKSEKYHNIPFTTNITKNWFQNTKVDFIGSRKIFFSISGVVVLVGLISLFTSGLKQGVDFSGGRNYIVRFEKPVSTVEVADMLKGSFGESGVTVITIGESNKVRITTNYRIMDNDPSLDEEIQNIIFNGVKPLLGDDVTLDMFVNQYAVQDGVKVSEIPDGAVSYGLQSSQKVGPTMADDIKTSAVWAVVIALIVIGLYILLRFRNIAFSLGAVVALVHDTLIIMGLFSLLKNIMPFSMEIDQSFIAAILTVIGYSINDKVVIFDRIRETVGLYPNRDKRTTINEALNSTLSRTFSTSMSTLVVLIIIFFFGGETIRGFIFAMLIGVIIGTYSSWFIATPIAYDILKGSDAKAAEERK